jgi:glycine/D-amino acid oxidase-like deaminating enzyme
MRVVVIGAGAFGGWTALRLLESGAEVTLVEARGPGNSQSSSGGETRIIRGAYGADRVSLRFTRRSFDLWREYEARWRVRMLHKTGMLVLGKSNDQFIVDSARELTSGGDAAEVWTRVEASRRFPQIDFDGIDQVLYEPGAGVLTARENCRTVTENFVRAGGDYRDLAVLNQAVNQSLSGVLLSDGTRLRADHYIFACGPWLGQMFPDVLLNVVKPSRQEVHFLMPPVGDGRFRAGVMPCWADAASEQKYYGIPDIQYRGFKIASDLRGKECNPSTMDRLATAASIDEAKRYIAFRFPALAGAPLVESRVCQYENTPDLGLLIDRHPTAENVWLVGGGSGHGYKQGPAVGEYVTGLLAGTVQQEPSFSLSRFTSDVSAKVSSF